MCILICASINVVWFPLFSFTDYILYVRASVRACVRARVCVCVCVSVCVCPCSGNDRPVDSVVWININHMLKLMINVYQAGEDTHTVLKI